jgi:cold shock protein
VRRGADTGGRGRVGGPGQGCRCRICGESGWVVVTGKVVRFDEFRGYGFVAPSTGGEDVFLHVNDLQFDKRLLGPGALVEFDVEEGDRGLKASHVRMISRGGERPVPSSSPLSSSSLPDSEAEPKPVFRTADDDGMCDVLSVKEFLEEVTETLLDAAPSITAEQIVHIRQRLAQVAHTHGWVEA